MPTSGRTHDKSSTRHLFHVQQLPRRQPVNQSFLVLFLLAKYIKMSGYNYVEVRVISSEEADRIADARSKSCRILLPCLCAPLYFWGALIAWIVVKCRGTESQPVLPEERAPCAYFLTISGIVLAIELALGGSLGTLCSPHQFR